MKTLRTILIACLLATLMVGLADACPTCKEGLSENGNNLVRGYFWSIIFMMSMPFLILAGLSTMFYLDVRRARIRKLAANEFVANEWASRSSELVPASSA